MRLCTQYINIVAVEETIQGNLRRHRLYICRSSREQPMRGIGIVSRRNKEQNALGDGQKLGRPTSKKQRLLPFPLRSPRGKQTELSMGPVEKKLLLVNLLARPPALREKKKEKREQCPCFPHGSSSAATSSRMTRALPIPPTCIHLWATFRTHTHRLGVRTATSDDDELSSRRRMGTSLPPCHPRGGALLTAASPRVPLVPKCSRCALRSGAHLGLPVGSRHRARRCSRLLLPHLLGEHSSDQRGSVLRLRV